MNETGPVVRAGNIRYELADKTRAIAGAGIGAIHRMRQSAKRGSKAQARPPGLLVIWPLRAPVELFSITKPTSSIRRAESADIRLEDDEFSRQHALVGRRGDRLKIADAGSAPPWRASWGSRAPESRSSSTSSCCRDLQEELLALEAVDGAEPMAERTHRRWPTPGGGPIGLGATGAVRCAEPMTAGALLTIGHEGRTQDEYLAVLREAGVTLLADVRRNPISRKEGFSEHAGPGLRRRRHPLRAPLRARHHLRESEEPRASRNTLAQGCAAVGVR